MAGDLENHSKVRRRREKGKGTGQTDMICETNGVPV